MGSELSARISGLLPFKSGTLRRAHSTRVSLRIFGKVERLKTKSSFSARAPHVTRCLFQFSNVFQGDPLPIGLDQHLGMHFSAERYSKTLLPFARDFRRETMDDLCASGMRSNRLPATLPQRKRRTFLKLVRNGCPTTKEALTAVGLETMTTSSRLMKKTTMSSHEAGTACLLGNCILRKQ